MQKLIDLLSDEQKTKRAEIAGTEPVDTDSDSRTLRTWSNKTGRFTVMVTFRGLIAGKVMLEKVAGMAIKILLDRLSEPDREYIRGLLRK